MPTNSAGTHPTPAASRRDWEDFIVVAYFGPGVLTRPRETCIRRAYLDFSRTLGGIAGSPTASRASGASLVTAIDHLSSSANTIDQDGFDKWHRNTCDDLKRICGEAGFPYFTIGQGQKWVNMTLKYIFFLGEKRVSGFNPIFPFCHVALDRQVIARLKYEKPPNITLPWSQIQCYNEYLRYQKWIRRSFLIAPLELELLLWNDERFDLKPHRVPSSP